MAPMKPKHKPPKQQRTMSHVEQLRTRTPRGTKRLRANPEEEAQRKQRKSMCDVRIEMRKQKQQARLLHHRSNNKQ